MMDEKIKTPLLYIDRLGVGINSDTGFLRLGFNSDISGSEMELYAMYAVPLNQLRAFVTTLKGVLEQYDKQLAQVREKAN